MSCLIKGMVEEIAVKPLPKFIKDLKIPAFIGHHSHNVTICAVNLKMHGFDNVEHVSAIAIRGREPGVYTLLKVDNDYYDLSDPEALSAARFLSVDRQHIEKSL